MTKYIKNLLSLKPKKGDKIKVAVGFSSFQNEGVVDNVYDDYCWIDQFYSDGRYKSSFTASFCYCQFIYI